MTKRLLISPFRIDQNYLAWIVWSVSALFLLFQFFLQLSSAEIVGGLMQSFSLTGLGASVLASTYYYIYVSLQAPVGALLDRYGPRLLLTLGAAVCGLGCWLFSISTRLDFAVIGRLLMGGGAAFAFVGSLSLIARWFPIRRFAIMVAVAETIGMFGGVFGGSLLAYLVIHMGWRRCMWGAAIIAVIISILLWLVVRDGPRGKAMLPSSHFKINFWQDIKVLIKNKRAWGNGFYSGLMFSIVTVFVSLWGVPFMQATHQLSLPTAAFVCNLVFIGIALGGPFIGWIDSRFICRRWIMVIGALISAGLISLVLYLPHLSIVFVGSLMFLLGFSCSSYVLTFVIANEIAPSHMRSTSVGFVNMLSVGSAPILQPVSGFLLSLLSHHSMGHYSVEQFQGALSFLPLALLSASVIAIYIPNRQTVSLSPKVS